MERSTALKKLRALLGNNAGYRVDDKAPTPGEREAARAALPAAREERNRLQEMRDGRQAATLAADAEYQRLCAEHQAASREVDRMSTTTRRYKITVGTTGAIFFRVEAEGDSWEEVIAKLKTAL